MKSSTSRGYPLLHITHHAPHPLEPRVVIEKIIQRQNAYEEGWQKKGRGNSFTTIFSLLHSYTHVWASLVIATQCSLTCGLNDSPDPHCIHLLYRCPPTS